jgi:hypothetical protein
MQPPSGPRCKPGPQKFLTNVTSNAAILAGAGEPGRARAPNENIEAATQQAKIEAIFDS